MPAQEAKTCSLRHKHGRCTGTGSEADRMRAISKLQSDKHMISDTQRRSSQAYDKQVISKIGGLQSPRDAASPTAEQPMVDMQNTLSRLNGQLANFGKSTFAHRSIAMSLVYPLGSCCCMTNKRCPLQVQVLVPHLQRFDLH